MRHSQMQHPQLSFVTAIMFRECLRRKSSKSRTRSNTDQPSNRCSARKPRTSGKQMSSRLPCNAIASSRQRRHQCLKPLHQRGIHIAQRNHPNDLLEQQSQVESGGGQTSPTATSEHDRVTPCGFLLSMVCIRTRRVPFQNDNNFFLFYAVLAFFAFAGLIGTWLYMRHGRTAAAVWDRLVEDAHRYT